MTSKQVCWITKDNFDLLATGGSASLLRFMENGMPEKEFKVAYEQLTADQKKYLPKIPGDFKIYVSSGKSRPPASLKDRIIKETLFEKKDIIVLIKEILKSKDQEKTYAILVDYDLHPVVLSQWLFWPLQKNLEGLDCLLKLEKYIYNKDAYYVLLATHLSGRKTKGTSFRFPKKLRG